MFFISSLESLVQSLRKTDEIQFKHLELLMSACYSCTKFKLFLRKGVCSYNFFNSFDMFDDYELQLSEVFLSTLRGAECL